MRDWKKMHNEELHNLFPSSNIIRIVKSGRMKWTGHVARTGRRGMHVGFWWGSQKERYHYEDLYVGGRIMFR
jgi:hypothetical protein